MAIGRITYQAWCLASVMPARLPALGILELDATDGEVRRVLATLEHHRHRLGPWVDASHAVQAPLTRRHQAIAAELDLIEALIDDIMRHWIGPGWQDEGYSSAREARRARRLSVAQIELPPHGDRDRGDYNRRVQAHDATATPAKARGRGEGEARRGV